MLKTLNTSELLRNNQDYKVKNLRKQFDNEKKRMSYNNLYDDKFDNLIEKIKQSEYEFDLKNFLNSAGALKNVPNKPLSLILGDQELSYSEVYNFENFRLNSENEKFDNMEKVIKSTNNLALDAKTKNKCIELIINIQIYTRIFTDDDRLETNNDPQTLNWIKNQINKLEEDLNVLSSLKI